MPHWGQKRSARTCQRRHPFCLVRMMVHQLLFSVLQNAKPTRQSTLIEVDSQSTRTNKTDRCSPEKCLLTRSIISLGCSHMWEVLSNLNKPNPARNEKEQQFIFNERERMPLMGVTDSLECDVPMLVSRARSHHIALRSCSKRARMI